MSLRSPIFRKLLLCLKINGQTVLPGEVRAVKELFPAAGSSDTQLKVERGLLALGMSTLSAR